jgi:hypothetical protein
MPVGNRDTHILRRKESESERNWSKMTWTIMMLMMAGRRKKEEEQCRKRETQKKLILSRHVFHSRIHPLLLTQDPQIRTGISKEVFFHHVTLIDVYQHSVCNSYRISYP